MQGAISLPRDGRPAPLADPSFPVVNVLQVHDKMTNVFGKIQVRCVVEARTRATENLLVLAKVNDLDCFAMALNI